MGTLTIRTDAQEDAAIEELKSLFGEASASKAILRAVTSYKRLKESDAEFSKKARNAEDKIKRINKLYRTMWEAKYDLEDELDIKE